MSDMRSFSANMGDLAAAKAQWSQRLLLSPKRQSIRGKSAPGAEAARMLTSAPTTDPDNNVVGVGIGWKITEGKDTGVMAVKFFVRMKYPEWEISSDHVLQSLLMGCLWTSRKPAYSIVLGRSPSQLRCQIRVPESGPRNQDVLWAFAIQLTNS